MNDEFSSILFFSSFKDFGTIFFLVETDQKSLYIKFICLFIRHRNNTFQNYTLEYKKVIKLHKKSVVMFANKFLVGPAQTGFLLSTQVGRAAKFADQLAHKLGRLHANYERTQTWLIELPFGNMYEGANSLSGTGKGSLRTLGSCWRLDFSFLVLFSLHLPRRQSRNSSSQTFRS